jgi:uncharacterized protein YndB with AHSA1/START domain
VDALEVAIDEFILAAPEIVWEHLATEEGMQTWQSASLFEAREGGAARFYLSESVDRADVDSAYYVMDGRILRYEPPRRLVYTWRQHIAPTGETWSDDTIIDIRLEAEGSGTRVYVRHYGFERLGNDGRAWRDGYARGWVEHDSLADLKSRIEGRGAA